MNFVDIIIIVIILLCTLLGWKKGVIKSLVQLLGFMAILIISYVFKDYLANYLMGFMPFFNFAGFDGVSAINILVYELLSFVVIFIILYCVLNVLLTLSGIVEKLLKMTIVLAIPSKILGAIVGAIEGIVIAFIVVFIMFHAGITSKYVYDSFSGIVLLERTPFIGQVMAQTTLALEDINELIFEYEDKTDEQSRKTLNAQALSIMIHYNIVSKETAEKLIEEEKIVLENVHFN